MKLPRRNFLRLAAGAAALPALSHVARAQAYPSRPIMMVVPFPAGGPVDTIARILAEPMRASLGQPILVENVSGAAGSIGVGRVARAAADGYTLSVGQWGTHVVNGAIYALQYNTLTDFQPVALLSSNPGLIVGRKGLPVDDLRGLIAWLKANADKATQSTSGVGGFGHIGGAFLQKATDTRYQFVPYRGGAPAMQDLVASQVDFMIDTPTLSLPQLRSGSIKGFAVMAKTRLAAAPDLPTVDEAGIPGLHLLQWNGVWAPKGTPRDIVMRLNDAIVRIMADPATVRKLGELGQDIYPSDQQTPDAFGAFHKAEIEKWWPIIKATGIKGE
jgi:tripartite-type tricarboxylate transporter receptor subunit TctC